MSTFGTVGEDAIDLGRIVHQTFHLGVDGSQHGDGGVGQLGLELAELLAGVLGDRLLERLVGERAINVEEILRFGAAFEFGYATVTSTQAYLAA